MSAAEMLAGAAPEPYARLAFHRLEEGLAYGSSAPGAYREGRSRRADGIKSRLWSICSRTRSVAGLWPFYESSVIRVRRLPVWTESSGTHRKPSRPLSAPCVGTVINRNRSAECTFPRATANGAGLGIPTMTDRAMQALYLLGLDPIAETQADGHSYGFRLERRCADALEQAHILLSHRHGPEWILEGDIKACFDRISHDWLLTHIPMDRQVLRKWLKAGFLEKHAWFATTEGTPQGGIISPALANWTLDGLQRLLAEHFAEHAEATTDEQSPPGPLCG